MLFVSSMLLVVAAAAAAAPARGAAAAPIQLVAAPCGRDGQNVCPPQPCDASLAGANAGNLIDLPAAQCNLDGFEAVGEPLPPLDDDGLLLDSIEEEHGHAVCVSGDGAVAIVQEDRRLHQWKEDTGIQVRFSTPVHAAVLCLVSLDKSFVTPSATSRVAFTAAAANAASGISSFTAATTHETQCFALAATEPFDAVTVANADLASFDAFCVQRVASDCADGTSCSGIADNNPAPAKLDLCANKAEGDPCGDRCGVCNADLVCEPFKQNSYFLNAGGVFSKCKAGDRVGECRHNPSADTGSACFFGTCGVDLKEGETCASDCCVCDQGGNCGFGNGPDNTPCLDPVNAKRGVCKDQIPGMLGDFCEEF